tara:strand:+ start:992 stop:1555 length:564 start_codon:yes stop_codon:yes gene_type:complete
MKKHKIDTKTFIKSWHIPEKICDQLVEYYLKSPDKNQGLVGNKINKKWKASTDVGVDSNDFKGCLYEYRKILQKCLKDYFKQYSFCKNVGDLHICEDYNIQCYEKGEGFYKWHFERTRLTMQRYLVFMTYLNTVKNGGTEFYYQKLKVDAVKGLTLIWPSDWTHTHKGVISKKQKKYILTGWVSVDV